MTALAVIVPTVGRSSLVDLLEALAEQVQGGDRVMVYCDRDERYDFCSEAVNFAREASDPGVAWRCFPTHGPLGGYGHPARNLALDLLEELDDAPTWCWSIDDDDLPVFGGLDMLRSAAASGRAHWYVFSMRGGRRSHFGGIVVPTMGNVLLRGNVGCPMLCWRLGDSRFGDSTFDDRGPGYFGDYEMAVALQGEYGDPVWVDQIVAHIRPVTVET